MCIVESISILNFQELNNIPVEDSVIHMTISTRFIDSLKEYVIKREAEKMEVGVPEFHNFCKFQIFIIFIITISIALFSP